MIDQEERRKMAWQLAQTMVARRDDIPMDRVAQAAWKVVDSFLENEGGGEVKEFNPYDISNIERLVARIALKNDEAEKLKAQNEKLKEELDCVTIDAKGWQEHYRDAYDEIDELKANADHLTRQLDDAKLWAGRHESTERELREKIEKLTKDRDEILREKAHYDSKLGAMEREFDQIKGELECRRAAIKQPQIDGDDDPRSDGQKHEQPDETIGDTIECVKARIAAVKARDAKKEGQ